MPAVQTRRRRRLTGVLAVSALTVAGLLLPLRHELTVPLGNGQPFETGTIRLSGTLLGAALAQSVDAVTIENVTVGLGASTYRVPEARFSGITLSRAELTGLFDAGTTEPMAARLSRLSAKQVTIPELIVEEKLGGVQQVTRYRNVVARDVVEGRIASLTSDSAAIETATKAGSASSTASRTGAGSGTLGRLSIDELDLAEIARLYGAKADTPTPEAKKIYGAFSMENLALAGSGGSEIKIAKLSGRDLLARPIKQSWADTLRELETLDTTETASPADRSRLLALTVDLLDAAQIGSVEATGVEMREEAGKDKASSRIARIAYTGAASDRPSDARVDGLEILADTGIVRIGTVAFTGFSFRPTLEGLKSLGGTSVESLDMAGLRSLIPTIGTVRLSGLDVDLPNGGGNAREPERTGPKPDATRFGIKDIEVKADRPFNGIPTDLRIGVENVTLAVPPASREDGLHELAALGYGAIDASFRAAASWNEPANELELRELTLRGADMGSIRLSSRLGQVSKDVFNPDGAVALVALLGAAAKTFDVAVENNGLFERVIAQEARKQKKSPDDLRREYGMAAVIAVPATLGNSAQAKSLGQAIARFVAKPGRLTISVRAKEAGGLGIADIVSLGDPAAVLDKLDVTATAE